MLKFIQINLNRCKAAQALLSQVAVEKLADLVFVSEPNRSEGTHWYMDKSGDAGIINTKKIRIENEGVTERGFRWIMSQGIRFYSCYWSPNSTFKEYLDFLTSLHSSIKSATTEVLITGDFNAKHSDWGSPANDKRGEALVDLINSTGLIVCNEGRKSTFNKGSIIDITIASPTLAQRVRNWKVLDEETLSDHFYVEFEISHTHERDSTPPQKPRKVDLNKLREALLSGNFYSAPTPIDAHQCANSLVAAVHKCCNIPNSHHPKQRKSVHWWTPEISRLRKVANHLRRTFQRKRKKQGAAASTTEEHNAKKAKTELVYAIRKAKDKAWQKLCDEVEHNPWGLPYKLVMGKLSRPPPIPELDTPGRIQKIVNGLFPKHPITERYVMPHLSPAENLRKIDKAELNLAAKSLKNNIAPGPDGITNEAVKTIVALNPEVIESVYNTCLTEGVFPKRWKRARLVLIRKGDKPLDNPSSYRPLCLLDCLGKLLEKVIDNRLRCYLDESDGLNEQQYGFRKGRSTVDALNCLKTTVSTSKKKVGVLAMDIKNAFNSAPWSAIMDAMEKKEVPSYLQKIISSYLEDRVIIFESGGVTEIDVTSGVPQGSVLGPTLWNLMYDSLLETRLPTGVTFLAFADDIALVATAKDNIALEQMLTTSAQEVHNWLNETGLELALHKCEAMIITKTRTNNEMNIIINGHKVETKGHMKYLGVHLDSKWSFSVHAKEVSAKASKVAQNLSRIMPNISAAKWRKRTLYSNIVHSILLYGAPTWAHEMSSSGWVRLKRVQRQICLRTASAYCTVSGDAIAVIAGVAPLDITARDRSDHYKKQRNPEIIQTREDPMAIWQTRWDESEKGRWTHELITDIRAWTKRKHGEINFHLTQVLSGHGCFSKYLKKYAKLNSEECWYCGNQTDDAYHTMFVCDAWYRLRNEAETYLGTRLTPGNMINTMLASKRNWHIVDDLAHKIMSHKEAEERRRQALPA